MTATLSLLDHLAARGGASLHARGRLATAALLNELPADTRCPLLEVGCGTGETAVQMCRRSVQVVATDVSTQMLRAAQARARWCGVNRRLQAIRVSRNGSLPFAAGAFGAVVVESVLAIQPDDVLPRLVGEISRVLQAGGRALVNETTWTPGTSSGMAAEINRRAAGSVGLIQATLSPFDAADWVEMFDAAGLRLIKTMRVDDLATGWEGRGRLSAVVVRSRAFTIWRGLRVVLAGGGFGRSRQMSRVLADLAPKTPCLDGRLFVLEPDRPHRGG
jgi:SAM-dependent methyltransferase